MESDLIEKKIVPYIRKHFSGQRLNHVLGTADLAERLAVRHRLNSNRARVAGLLHDLARGWSEKRLVRYVRRYCLKIPNRDLIVRYHPSLLHSVVSAHLAGNLFDIKDREIVSAVCKHTLGAVKMSRFEKLIYVADLIAPDRKFKCRKRLEELSFKDIDLAFKEALKIKMNYVIKTEQWLHPGSVRVWNHYILKNNLVSPTR